MTKRLPSFIRLVETTHVAKSEVTSKTFATREWQNTLFAQNCPSLLVYIDFENTKESDFLSVLKNAKPRFVIDLRLVPRFDLGNTNRKHVFSIFTQNKTKYFDVSGALGIKNNNDARLNPEILCNTLLELVFRGNSRVEGPIVFLIDSYHFNEDYIYKLTEAITPISDIGWEILLVLQNIEKPKAPSNNNRNKVFISHANPDDNDFVLWLSSRLKCAGYEIWSDVTTLLGGEEFWDNIEETIRQHSSKVIVVLSHKSQSKKGVLDEINCAVSVERSQGIDGFVIPIRLDNLPFDQVRANLARKNIIDFHQNWAQGLIQLTKLLQNHNVPCKGSQFKNISEWHHNGLYPNLQNTKETLISSWLTFTLPNEVILYEANAPQDKLNSIARSLPFPNFRYMRLIGTFTDVSFTKELCSQNFLKESSRISITDFLKGKSERLPGMGKSEAQNYISNLIRQAWNQFAASKGLQPTETSSGSAIWFIPKGLIESDRATFIDLDNKQRKRNLVGWSKKRQFFWHYGIEIKSVLGHLPHINARAHIVFSKDGLTLLDSKERMHILRRSFCKSWWNDRWRDLFLAFIAWLSEGKDIIKIPAGGLSTIELSANPLTFISPVSIIENSINDLVDELPDEPDNEVEIEALNFDDNDSFDLEESL